MRQSVRGDDALYRRCGLPTGRAKHTAPKADFKWVELVAVMVLSVLLTSLFSPRAMSYHAPSTTTKVETDELSATPFSSKPFVQGIAAHLSKVKPRHDAQWDELRYATSQSVIEIGYRRPRYRRGYPSYYRSRSKWRRWRRRGSKVRLWFAQPPAYRPPYYEDERCAWIRQEFYRTGSDYWYRESIRCGTQYDYRP